MTTIESILEAFDKEIKPMIQPPGIDCVSTIKAKALLRTSIESLLKGIEGEVERGSYISGTMGVSNYKTVIDLDTALEIIKKAEK